MIPSTATSLVDAGGYRLSVEVRGSGAPAVVCVSGMTGDHSEWAAVAPAVAATTTVLTYVRPGRAGSDALPEHLRSPWSALRAAEELRSLLANSGLVPPYILAGHSIGGLFAAVYAGAWPKEIAGLVLIDPTDPADCGEAQQPPWVDHPEGATLDLEDVRREFGILDLPPVPAVVVTASPGSWLADPPERYLPNTLQEMDDWWQGAQRDWASRARAVHLISGHGGHCVHVDDPELVTRAVVAVVTAARTGQPMT